MHFLIKSSLIALLLSACALLTACMYTATDKTAIANETEQGATKLKTKSEMSHAKITNTQDADAEQLVEDFAEVLIDVDHFDTQKTNLSSWAYVFSLNNHPSGSEQRVASFESAQALIDDTLQHLKLQTGIIGADYVAQTIVQRATEKVDFKKHDLVVVYLSDGGPPFGDFVIRKTMTGFAFCIQRPNPDSVARGRALKTVFKFFAIPKGESVQRC